MAKSFKGGTKKTAFLDTISVCDIETSNIAERCKFNFSYFTEDPAGQKFDEWENNKTLSELLCKIKEYTNKPISYWISQSTLVNYKSFPNKEKTDFTMPKHIPHDVHWGRFRLGSKIRLVGFILPGNFEKKECIINNKNYIFDTNTFYVTFLDNNHKFYKVEKK